MEVKVGVPNRFIKVLDTIAMLSNRRELLELKLRSTIMVVQVAKDFKHSQVANTIIRTQTITVIEKKKGDG